MNELDTATAMLGLAEGELKREMLSPAVKKYIQAVDNFVTAVDNNLEARS